MLTQIHDNNYVRGFPIISFWIRFPCCPTTSQILSRPNRCKYSVVQMMRGLFPMRIKGFGVAIGSNRSPDPAAKTTADICLIPMVSLPFTLYLTPVFGPLISASAVGTSHSPLMLFCCVSICGSATRSDAQDFSSQTENPVCNSVLNRRQAPYLL